MLRALLVAELLVTLAGLLIVTIPLSDIVNVRVEYALFKNSIAPVLLIRIVLFGLVAPAAVFVTLIKSVYPVPPTVLLPETVINAVVVLPLVMTLPLVPDIVVLLPVNEFDDVIPVTVKLPLTVNPVIVLNNTLKVPPALLVYVKVLFEYDAPVTLISVGRF